MWNNSTGTGSPNSGRNFWIWPWLVIARHKGSESRELHEATAAFIQNFVRVACMTHRVAILTEIIAPYRIPVFNVLARRAGLDLRVIFLAETDEALRQWRGHKNCNFFSPQGLPSSR